MNYKIETTLEAMRDSYDWKEAFKYADPNAAGQYSDPGSKPQLVAGATCSADTFRIDDVAEVLASAEGENDGAAWIALLRLKDGRYAFLEASCDYTGWGCQEGGSSWVAEDLARIVQFGMGDEARSRLGVVL